MIKNDRTFPPLAPERAVKLSVFRVICLAVLCVLIAQICIVFIDRPASTWSHEFLADHPFFVWMSRLVEPFVPLSGIALALAGCGALNGWHPGQRYRTFLTACMALFVASTLRTELKALFGRTWPETFVNNNPSWIKDGAYGFHPFHGGAGWSSFPSGHTALTISFLTVFWVRMPRYRALYVLLAAVEVLGLYGADYHFIGDIFAGGVVGIVAALVTLLLTEKASQRDG